MPTERWVTDLLSRCTFPPPGSALDCAVSGGADSLALLVLAVEAECVVTAWHVDHGLRPGSAVEAEVVREAAVRFGAAFRSLAGKLDEGPNLEERARSLRRSLLPPGVATGHTADDQAETVLINLLRGSGLDGLSAMRPGPSHPLLGLRRQETHKVCAALGLAPVEDPTNNDLRFVRNAIRHDVLPLLDQVAGRDVAALLARQAALLRDEADLLDSLASSLDATDPAALRSAPEALARRAVRTMLKSYLGGRPPAADAVERVLEVARGEATGTEVADGVRVDRRQGRLVVSRA